MADKKQINPKKPIPSSGYDRLRENLESNFAEGFPVENFPNEDNRANINRGRITSRKGNDDKTKDISIGLQDHDEAIMYYFNQVIKPSVIINGDRKNVPLIYGSPERWKGVQKDGYYRDKEGKIQVPLIMFKRDSVDKRRDLGRKLDANNPQLYYTFQEKYTNRNQYDNFSILQNRKPQKEFHAVVIPDYVNITYSCIIWTDYIAQMNKLIESINYSSDSYWGDPERFKFNARIDTYNNTTELAQGSNRNVKTNFGLKIQGYLISDNINKELAKKPQKFFSKAVVSFGTELEVLTPNKPKTRKMVREATGEQNIKQAGRGVGYQEIGQQSAKITGLPFIANQLFSYNPASPYIVNNTSTNISGITGRRLIQWSDTSDKDRHLLPDDGGLFNSASNLYGFNQYGVEAYNPVYGGEEQAPGMVNQINSENGFIFSRGTTGYSTTGKIAKFSSRINKLEKYTLFASLVQNMEVSSSYLIASSSNQSWNSIITGHSVYNIQTGGYSSTSSAAIFYTNSASESLAHTQASGGFLSGFEEGNQSIQLFDDELTHIDPTGYNQYSIDCRIPRNKRIAPQTPHVLTVSVDATSGSGFANACGEVKVRINGEEVFTTGSSGFSGSSFSFDYLGGQNYEIFHPSFGGWSAQAGNEFSGTIKDITLIDGVVSNAEMRTFEEEVASRTGIDSSGWS
tara:strand:+ start:936 stop:2987 length:2052 start_codon:yes stop_codon:yes gene_type:complete